MLDFLTAALNILIYYLIPFVIVLGILVVIHELGHFLTARWFGVGVKVFAIGMPPTIWRKKKGETEYQLNAVPLGGFVRLVGEDEEENKQPDSFQVKPPWQRFIILGAGSLTHFVLAFLVFAGLALALGRSVPNDQVFVVDVVADSPAAQAELEVGQEILSVNGVELESVEALQQATAEAKGQPLTLEVQVSDSAIRTVEVTPRSEYPADQGPLGVGLLPGYDVEPVGLFGALQDGWDSTVAVVQMTFDALGNLVGNLFTQGQLSEDVSGPVGIARASGDVFKAQGVVGLLWIMGLLAANLAVFNLMPFPALDGGRMLFVVWEWITRKPVPPDKEAMVHTVGFGLLITFLIAVTVFNDVL